MNTSTGASNVVSLFGQDPALNHQDLLNLAHANLLYAAADLCRVAIDAEDRPAVRLAQTIIVQIRSFGEETVHDGVPDP